ncbi:hypothetical protein BLNAU_2040 [Blattamonas nauphoetae]|uniref:Uncharacterized protein n=1 Tax=Blattamonas nauphoetae TaxID=2049346 RepID=A0ABQ9YGY8_9EUKA|nr:hypothetical protein BLNAU_2040 [Blattamonas nauphoetae]
MAQSSTHIGAMNDVPTERKARTRRIRRQCQQRQSRNSDKLLFVMEPLNWKEETERLAAVGLCTLDLAQRTLKRERFQPRIVKAEESEEKEETKPSKLSKGTTDEEEEESEKDNVHEQAEFVEENTPHNLLLARSKSPSSNANTAHPKEEGREEGHIHRDDRAPEKDRVYPAPKLDFDEVEEGGFTLLAHRAIKKCKRARIRVVMITGDHAKTAAAIGALLSLNPHKVTTSQELAELNDEELSVSVDSTHIYARDSCGRRPKGVHVHQASHPLHSRHKHLTNAVSSHHFVHSKPAPLQHQKNIFTSNFFIRTMYWGDQRNRCCPQPQPRLSEGVLHPPPRLQGHGLAADHGVTDPHRIAGCARLCPVVPICFHDGESELRNVVSSNLSFAAPASTESHPAVTSKIFSPPDAVPTPTSTVKKEKGEK